MMWRNSGSRWGWLSVAMHWLTAVVVFGLFGLGLWMVELNYYHSWYRTAPFIHKSIGVSLFLLTLFRLLWRWWNVTPQPLQSHSLLERRAAAAGHMLLYMLLFNIMFSGYLISTADGRPVEVFNVFNLPATIHGLEQQEDVAGDVHRWLGWTLMALIVVHAAAAIKHHVYDKDVTLKRMLGQ
jgi:cytochrome b561